MAMDVHTGESGPGSDPSITAVVPATPGSRQGQLFNDPNGDSFANTDQLPAVPRERRNERGYRAPRLLRAALAVVVVVILAAGAVLALVKTGVIDGTRNPHSGAQSQSSSHTTTPARNGTHVNDLLTPSQTFAGSGSANYTVPAKAFAVTVTAGPGRSWVSIGIVGQQPIFAGILQPNSSQGEILLGQAEVSIGAGGTTVTVQAGHKKQTLMPPSAPFSYQFTPAG